MSDYTQGVLHIFSVDNPTPENLEALIELLTNAEMQIDWGGTRTVFTLDDLAPLLNDGRVFEAMDDQCRLDFVDEMAPALAALDAGLTFDVSQEPKYEYDGEIAFHTPKLGTRHMCSDSDGSPHFTADDIERAVRDAIDELTGSKWRKHFAALWEQENERWKADHAPLKEEADG